MAWIFGYGSLIWRPDFAYLRRERATLAGFTRRFWQGSHDHRGTPAAPGRVVTLIPDQNTCVGCAYQVDTQVFDEIQRKLDVREKNGYSRFTQDVTLDRSRISALVYMATSDNPAFLGDADPDVIARQIAAAAGPSGTNRDYLFELAAALRALDAADPHVFELEQRVRGLVRR